jgi:hypothetical protein
VLTMLPEQSFQDLAGELLRQAQRDRLLLVVDQMEELYTLVRDSAKRDNFLDLLMEVARDTRGVRQQLTGLVAIRADYEAVARADSSALDRLLTRNILHIPPMTQTELSESITRPAKRAGITLEEGLAERIVKEFQNQPNALPMLEVLLDLLWESQQKRTLTLQSYLRLGGVEGALTGYANGVYDRLEDDDQTRARRVLMQLVGLAEGSPQARRPLLERDVRSGDWAVVERLAAERLLRMDTNESGETFAELVHESLSWSWDRLHEWITDAEEKLRKSDEKADRIAKWFSLGAGGVNLLPPPLDIMAVGSTFALMGRQIARAYEVKIDRHVLRTAGISMAGGMTGVVSAGWGGTELIKAVPGMSVWVGLLVQPPMVAAIAYAVAATWKYYFRVVSAGGRGPDDAEMGEFVKLTFRNYMRRIEAKRNAEDS